MKLLKRVISFILVLCMLADLIPGFAISASAAESQSAITEKIITEEINEEVDFEPAPEEDTIENVSETPAEDVTTSDASTETENVTENEVNISTEAPTESLAVPEIVVDSAIISNATTTLTSGDFTYKLNTDTDLWFATLGGKYP